MIRILTIAGALALLMSACGEKAQEKGGGGPIAVPVQSLTLQHTRLHQSYPVSIEGKEIVEIRPRIQGYLEDIYVDEGQRVKKGQLLFKVNADNFEQQVLSAKAKVKVAEAAVQSANNEVLRLKPLVEKGVVGEFELTQAEYSVASAEAALVEAQANVKNMQTNIDYSRITAPSDGVIGTIAYRKGSLVSPTSTNPITILANNSEVRAYFSVNEKAYLDYSSDFKVDSSKHVELILANGKAYPNTGTLDAVSGIIDKSTGSIVMRATFPNPDLLLKSGGSGTINIEELRENVILIPQAATFEVQNKRFVYVVQNDNKVQTQLIKVTPTDDGQQFVVEEGLKEGDEIVVSGINGLKAGMEINPEKAD